MRKLVNLHEKDMQVTLTKSAEGAVKLLTTPLLAEIHLIFGCLVVKRVWFKEYAIPESETISGNLNVCFRTVRYSKQCRLSHIDSGVEEPMNFPLVADKKAFVPKWLRIDYKKGKWVGTYGYDRSMTPDGKSWFF
jgi:hypothetical protein